MPAGVATPWPLTAYYHPQYIDPRFLQEVNVGPSSSAQPLSYGPRVPGNMNFEDALLTSQHPERNTSSSYLSAASSSTTLIGSSSTSLSDLNSLEGFDISQMTTTTVPQDSAHSLHMYPGFATVQHPWPHTNGGPGPIQPIIPQQQSKSADVNASLLGSSIHTPGQGHSFSGSPADVSRYAKKVFMHVNEAKLRYVWGFLTMLPDALPAFPEPQREVQVAYSLVARLHKIEDKEIVTRVHWEKSVSWVRGVIYQELNPKASRDRNAKRRWTWNDVSIARLRTATQLT